MAIYPLDFMSVNYYLIPEDIKHGGITRDKWRTLRWISQRQVIRMGGVWNWLSIMPSGGLWCQRCGTSGFCYWSWLISKMDLREIGCEDGRWMELAQDRVQLRDLVLAVLNLRVLLPESVN
jgi:hypothetical protein